MNIRLNRGDRRSLIRRALVLASAVAVVGARSTSALRGWCRSDPLISIDGDLADIFATAEPRILTKVKGPTQIIILTPRNVKTRLILAGPGFGRGEKVRMQSSRKLKKTAKGIQVEIRLKAPASERLPIGVEFAPRIVGILKPDRAEGFTNEWVTLTTILKNRGAASENQSGGGGLVPIDLPIPVPIPGLTGRDGERRDKGHSGHH